MDELETELAEARAAAVAQTEELEQTEESTPTETEEEAEQTTEDTEPKEEAEEEEQDEPEKEEAESEEKETTEDAPEAKKDNWIPKRKNKTPARERISQLTAKARAAERENAEIKAKLEQMEKLVYGDGEKKESDFVDKSEYEEYTRKKTIEDEVAARMQAYTQQQEAVQKQEYLKSTYAQNVESARKDLVDLDEVVADLNPNIAMSTEVREHLAQSPAGIYTLYHIASDPKINDGLVGLSEAETRTHIAQIHDHYYNNLAKRQQVQQTAPVKAEAPKIAKPPKKIVSEGVDNLAKLDGEDFMEAYNKKYYS